MRDSAHLGREADSLATKRKRAPAKDPAPVSEVRLARPQSEHDSLHELLAFTRGPLMDTVEDLENQREEARAILREWIARGGSGQWMMKHYQNRLMVALGME